MDNLRIDSHKLIYHIPRLYQWQKGENIYPIYLEIGLYGGCNHRCIFCAFNYLDYRRHSLSSDCAKNFICQAADRGVKSVLYSGEGEPLLNKQAAEIVSFTKEKSIDTALSTNGVLLDKNLARRLLANLTWIRISLNAGSKKKYALIHGTKQKDFVQVIKNIRNSVEIKNKYGYSCTIGVQLLLLKENFKEAVKLAKILSETGIDYFVIKPYCSHPLSRRNLSQEYRDHKLQRLSAEINRYSRPGFKIILRHNAAEKSEKEKLYNYCYGLSFAAHIDAGGDTYPCNAFVGKKEYSFGNICADSFEAIWEGRKRKEILKKIKNDWDLKNCRRGCRLDEINRYLWELKHPPPHINFI